MASVVFAAASGAVTEAVMTQGQVITMLLIVCGTLFGLLQAITLAWLAGLRADIKALFGRTERVEIEQQRRGALCDERHEKGKS